jgi:hypothetical protein
MVLTLFSIPLPLLAVVTQRPMAVQAAALPMTGQPAKAALEQQTKVTTVVLVIMVGQVL